MKLFLSSEQHSSASYSFNKISKPIIELLEPIISQRDFGKEFESIGIITIIVPIDLLNNGFFKERKYINRKNKMADIRLSINLEKFINESEDNQKLLYVKNIIDSIKVIGKRKKEDFNDELLISDILELLHISKKDIENILG